MPMGSGEDSTQAKAASKAPAAAPAAAAPTGQEVPTTPSMYADWQSMAAYYGGAAAAGTPQAFFSPPSPAPYMWGGQHMMPPYGTPVPYMYPPGMYPHPAMTPGTTVAAAEIEGRTDGKDRNSSRKPKGGLGNANQGNVKSGDVAKATSANDDTSQSDGSGTEGSSNAGDEAPNHQDASITGKRTFEKMNVDGMNMQQNTTFQYGGPAVESNGKGRPSSNIPVSVPGKIAVPAPSTNLNISMDIWNGPHVGSVPIKERPSAVNITPSVAPSTIIGRDGVVPGNQWIQDDRELKRQKRKESNRESARRSRQRKQQECEELQRKVEELTSDNDKLRSELEQLKQQCKTLDSENASIREELTQMGGPETEGNNVNALVPQSVDGEGDHLVSKSTGGSSAQPNGAFLTSNGNH